MKDIIRFEYEEGKKFIYPAHPMVQDWRFSEDREEEAVLCNSMAIVAEKNGINGRELLHLFPAVLRILNDNRK